MRSFRILMIISGILLMMNQLEAQDFDMYKKEINDRFEMPQISESMTFEEFQLLSRDLRMKDMLYAMVVPGYTHFYAHKPKIGYGMLGARLIGYGGLTYVLIKGDNNVNLKNILGFDLGKDDFSDGKDGLYSAISAGSIAVIIGSYLFDWIHGQHALQKQQEEIRYKYSIMMNLQTTREPVNQGVNEKVFPVAGIKVRF
ncbi:MAG: hypothetical protein ACQESX_10765 [Bacteroidota bacterium]